jgi:hypothetical protein
VTERDGALQLSMGPKNQTFTLAHWDGDAFTFTLTDENAPPGTISKATFAGNTLNLEYFDTAGTASRAGRPPFPAITPVTDPPRRSG